MAEHVAFVVVVVVDAIYQALHLAGAVEESVWMCVYEEISGSSESVSNLQADCDCWPWKSLYLVLQEWTLIAVSLKGMLGANLNSFGDQNWNLGLSKSTHR